MSTKEKHGHIVEYKTFITVYVVLLALTGSLVAISHFGHSAAVGAMLTITPLKAGLVFYYFMHLKYESPLLKGMLFTAITTLVVFLGLMFLDISFR